MSDQPEAPAPSGWSDPPPADAVTGVVAAPENPAKRAYKKDQIEQRRRSVFRLKQMGMSRTQIADTLHCHRNTIANDMKELEKQRRDIVIDAEGFSELGGAIMALDSIYEQAMADVLSARAGSSERNSLLRTAMNAQLEKTRMMQEAGVIPKVADQLHLTGAVELLKLPTDALMKRRAEIIQQLASIEGVPVPAGALERLVPADVIEMSK